MTRHWIRECMRKTGLAAAVAALIVGVALATLSATVSTAQETRCADKAVGPAPRAGIGNNQHEGHAEHDDHEGHDHGDDHKDRDAGAKHDDHEGHEHGDARDGHEEEDGRHGGGHDAHEEDGLTLSAQARANVGLVIAKAAPGDLKIEISMPGEVSLNADRVARVVPLVSGIVREVRATVGDRVDTGDVLAVLDSSELGEAKLDYLTKINEILCCSILVPRAQAVHDNTLRLLAFLDGEPALEDLRTFKRGEVGENLKTLTTAYAHALAARQIFEREKGLYAKEIASEQDYLAAKTEYEKAMAEYLAGRDSIAFEIKRALFETTAKLRAAKFEARTSEQRLRLMGIADKEIHALDELILPEKQCTDPKCADCPAGVSEDAREHYFGNGFSRYEIRSPVAGIIVERHIVRGERTDAAAEIFTIADTRTVWVNLTVYLKNLDAVRVGGEVTVRAEHSGREARGRITMVSPIVDKETRTATARVVLENADDIWRPGVFVVGRIAVSAKKASVVVPKNAVQTIEGESVVFVPEGGEFKPVPVRIGRSDRERVEIISGLAPGTPFVARGAFELKAKLVTGSLGSHAGHGH